MASKSTKGERIAVATLATATAAALLVSLGRHTESKKDDARIAKNEQTITHVSSILDGVVYLKDGVHGRSSMAINNGQKTREGVNPDNISLTVGEGKYAGKYIAVTRPAILTDKENDQWIAFDEPGTKNDTLKEKAAHLVYVDIGEIALQSPDSLVVEPYKEGGPTAEPINVDYIDAGKGLGMFENGANDRGVSYAMTATAPKDTGK